MIALAVAAIAVCSQASAFKWTISSGYPQEVPGTDTDITAVSSVYLFAGLDTSAKDAMVSAFVAGTLDLASMTSVASGSIEEGTLASDVTFNYGADGDANVFTMVFVTDDAEYLFISEDVRADGISAKTTKVTMKPYDASQNIFEASAGYSEAGYYQSVPEPTSGLLLLLGMAGLALKRKLA